MSRWQGGTSPVMAGRHLVHFYSGEQDFATTVGRYVVESLGGGGVAVAVALPRHLRAVEAELCRAGVDLAAARESASYVTFDSEQMVRRIIVDGRLDRDRVDSALGEVAQAAARTSAGRFVYTDTSPLLWQAGMIDAALELEARVAERLEHLDATLLCAYPLRSLAHAWNPEAVRQLCHRHTYVTSLPFTPRPATVAASRASKRHHKRSRTPT